MRRLTSSRFPSLAASCRSELCSVVVSTETVFSCHVREEFSVNFNFIMAYDLLYTTWARSEGRSKSYCPIVMFNLHGDKNAWPLSVKVKLL